MRCVLSERIRLQRRDRQRETLFYWVNGLFIASVVVASLYSLFNG